MGERASFNLDSRVVGLEIPARRSNCRTRSRQERSRFNSIDTVGVGERTSTVGEEGILVVRKGGWCLGNAIGRCSGPD